MIYLKNKTLLQDVYIPRQDMLPYTTGSSGTYAEGYSDGYEDGTQDQKDKLASTAFTENGLYTREDGWNEVEVSVEAPLPVLEDKTVVISADTTTVTPSSGYDGMSQVIVDASGYAQENYDGGFEDGFEDGYSSGSTDEKAKLSGVTFTANTQVSLDDGGYSAVTVNVPQTGHTDQELEDAYQSGYTSGETHQKGLLTTTAFTENGSYSRENGWSGVTVNVDTASTYNSGYTDGYDSGYTSGETYQKSLLVSTAITQNGSYQRENGYSAITVNVPTGQTYNIEQNKPFTATSNGNYTITPSSGTTTVTDRFDSDTDRYYITATTSGFPLTGRYNLFYIEDEFDSSKGQIDVYIENGYLDYDDSDWDGGEIVDLSVSGNIDLFIRNANRNFEWHTLEDFDYHYDAMSAVSLTVNVPQTGSTNSIISVTGNTWYVLDHQFTTGEKIEITNATFDYSVANSARHQQLIAGGEGEWVRIGGSGDFLYTAYYGDSKMDAGPIILDDDHILLTNGEFYINDMETPVSTFWPYQTGITEGSNMVVFANTSSGNDSVCGQTASVGVITIYDENDNVVDKYIPELHNGFVCLHNVISGNYISPSGTGTPTITSTDYNEGYMDGRQDVIDTFTAMTATTNGVYGSSAHPLSSITVNVPQSGGSGTTKIFFADYIHTDTLQADSTNRINTGIYPTTATTFRVKGLGKGLSAGYELVGFDLNDAGEDSDYRLFCYSTSGANLGFDWYSQRITNENWGGLTDGKSIDFTCSNYQVYDNINETVLLSGSPQSNMAQGVPIYVNVASWWLKGLEIWEGNTKVFDGVAAYDENGNVGLYDSVSNALVTNENLTLEYEIISPSVYYNSGYTDGYEEAFDDVESSAQTLSVSANGTYNTSLRTEGYLWDEVIVNVPQTGSPSVLGTKTITENGTYSASTDNLDGYSAVTVNVQSGIKYVEYLETDGSEISWDTGVKLEDINEVVYFDFAPLSGNATGDAYFPFLSQQYRDFTWNLAIRTTGGDYDVYGSYQTRFGDEYQMIQYSVGNKNVCVLSNSGATVNGVDYLKQATGLNAVDWNIIINGQKKSDGFQRFPVGRYYGFKIMSGNTAVIDLKPALDGNDVPCFYDEVSKTYIYHSGSGTPIAGPVSPSSDYISGFTDGYASGYTDGYNSGFTDGYNSGLTDGYNSGFTDGYNSGLTDGYDSGFTDGYNSGYTDGQDSIISTFSSMTATTNGVYGSTGHPLSSITVAVQTADYGELIGLYCTNNCQFILGHGQYLEDTSISFGIRTGNVSINVGSSDTAPSANRIEVDSNGNVTGYSYSYSSGSGAYSTGSGQTSVVLNAFPTKNYMVIETGVKNTTMVNSSSASTCMFYQSTPANGLLLSIDDGYFYGEYINNTGSDLQSCIYPHVDSDGNACILGNNGLFYPISGECYPIYKNGNNYYVLMKSQPWNQQ